MEMRAVGEIRPHPENQRIYGDEAGADLVNSVRDKGIFAPLLVTQDDRIISGHRRWLAAKEAGLDAVPVIVFGLTDELDILEALVESNRQRVKTNEQLAREYETLKRVYHERHSRQGERSDLMGETSGKDLPEVPQPPSRQAAEALGRSHVTLNKAAAVVEEIDALEEAGQEEEADDLRATLNESVNGAYQRVHPPKPGLPSPPPTMFDPLAPDWAPEPEEEEPVAPRPKRGPAPTAVEREAAEKAKNDAHSRSIWFRNMQGALTVIQEWVARRSDDHLTWYTRPGEPGAEAPFSGQDVMDAAEQLRRVCKLTFHLED